MALRSMKIQSVIRSGNLLPFNCNGPVSYKDYIALVTDGRKMLNDFWWGSREHFQDLGINGRAISEWI
jgi:hypothetical protein